MARKKISEFTAKSLLFSKLGKPYLGISVIGTDTLSYANLDKNKKYVVKVDEGIKARMKKGLVALQVPISEIRTEISDFIDKGYHRFLIEEFVPHSTEQEKYFSLERTREGIKVYYSQEGGIDIESKQHTVKTTILLPSIVSALSEFLQVPEDIFTSIIELFNEQYFSFLEINPIVVNDKNCFILDLAVEVDSSAEFFVTNGWTSLDFVGDELLGQITEEEKNIINLKAKSQAAFKLDMLNPNGSIWMLLSGGGASIVLADEVFNQGKGNEIANYGEYSGNPNQQETYLYTKNILQLLLKSQAEKKVLIIGGGVANFTDIRVTFQGVIRALDAYKTELLKQQVKVFVRRGGPNQGIGLSAMKKFLEEAQILGGVWDSSLVLSDIITKAKEYVYV